MRTYLIILTILFGYLSGCKILTSYKNDNTIPRLKVALNVVKEHPIFLSYCKEKDLNIDNYFIKENNVEPWLPPFISDYMLKNNINYEEASSKITALNLNLQQIYNRGKNEESDKYYFNSKSQDIGIFWFPIEQDEIVIIIAGRRNNTSLDSGYLAWGNNSLYYWLKIQNQKVEILYTGYD